jgi:hypothetical protein
MWTLWNECKSKQLNPIRNQRQSFPKKKKFKYSNQNQNKRVRILTTEGMTSRERAVGREREREREREGEEAEKGNDSPNGVTPAIELVFESKVNEVGDENAESDG